MTIRTLAALLLAIIATPALAAYGVPDANGYTAQYETDIGSVPSCDQTIATGDAWATINWSNTTICLGAGDHTAKGALTIGSDGSSGTRKWLRCSDAGTGNPYHLASGSRCKVRNIDFAGHDYWNVFRLEIDGSNGNFHGIDLKSTMGANNDIFDHLYIHNAGGNNKRLFVSNANTGLIIQNSILEQTPATLDQDNQCIEIQSATNARIVNNEVRRCNSLLATKSTNPGTVVENNDFYQPTSEYTDCAGNYTTSGPCSAREGGVSHKGGGTVAAPYLFLHNRVWGARYTDACCSLGTSEGYGFTISSDVPSPSLITRYARFVNNYVCDSQRAIGMPRDTQSNNTIVGNIVCDIVNYRGTDSEEPLSDGIKVRASDFNDYYLNTFENANNWARFESSATDNDVKGSLVILSGDASNKAVGTNTEIGYNGFLGTPVYSPFGNNVDKSTQGAARQDSHAYSVGDIYRLSPTDGYMYVVTIAGTSASSAPTMRARLGSYTKDGTAVVQAILGPWTLHRQLQTTGVAAGNSAGTSPTVSVPYVIPYNTSNNPFRSAAPAGATTGALGSRTAIGADDIVLPGSPYDKDILGTTRNLTANDLGAVQSVGFAAVTDLTATPGDGKATLTWGAVSGADHYNLYYSTSENFFVQDAILAGNVVEDVTSPYDHSTSTAYYYVVTAIDDGSYGGIESLRSNRAGTTPIGAGTPAYAFVAAGTTSIGTAALTPGQPAGKSAGDLLLLESSCRSAIHTFTPPAGYTALATTASTANYSLAIAGRIATGDASDDVNADMWDGSSTCDAQLAAFSGDVYTDLGTIVAHIAYSGDSANTADIPTPALSISTDNALVICAGHKEKSSTSDGATLTSPSGCTNRISASWPAGTSVGHVWDYVQQTTATNVFSGSYTQSIAQSQPYSSMILALKTGEAAGPPSGVPTIDSITVDTNSISVAYTYSGDDSTGISFKLNGQSSVDSGGANPFTIAGLASGTTYSPGLQIAAVNGYGEGEFSAPEEFTTDALPVVPDVVGLSEPEATQDLEAAGYVVATASTFDPAVEIGHVISQSPTAGSGLDPGETVTITLSLGAGAYEFMSDYLINNTGTRLPNRSVKWKWEASDWWDDAHDGTTDSQGHLTIDTDMTGDGILFILDPVTGSVNYERTSE